MENSDRYAANHPYEWPRRVGREPSAGSISSRFSAARRYEGGPIHGFLEDALHPDPGTEADFQVDDNPFAFSPGQLSKLLAPKSLEAFLALGGLDGLVKGLQTNQVSGLSIDETSVPTAVTFEEATRPKPLRAAASPPSAHPGRPLGDGPFSDRIRVFGTNLVPEGRDRRNSCWGLIRKTFNFGTTLLLVFACVSFTLAIITLKRGKPQSNEATDSKDQTDWVEGVAIFVTAVAILTTSAYNRWQAESVLRGIRALTQSREVRAIRSGKSIVINSNDILVGDIALLESGDIVPADGIFISSHGVACDESQSTGESDAIKKTDASAVMSRLKRAELVIGMDPFAVSGSRILKGTGKFVVTAVGVNSNWGKLMMCLSFYTEPSPLEKKLRRLAWTMARLGCAVALIVLLVLASRFVAGLKGSSRPLLTIFSQVADIYATVTIIVFIAVCPGALSFLALFLRAYAAPRLLKSNALVRVPSVQETLSKVTTVCCEKSWITRDREMPVIGATVAGVDFGTCSNATAAPQTISQWAACLGPQATDALIQLIAVNSTAYEGEDESRSTYIGDSMEAALLKMANDHLALGSLAEERTRDQVMEVFPFDPDLQYKATIVKRRDGAGCRLLVNSAPEVLLNRCGLKADSPALGTSALTTADSDTFKLRVQSDLSKGHRVLGLAYCDLDHWTPGSDVLNWDSFRQSLVFLGFLSLDNRLRNEVPMAVYQYQRAGIVVRMVTDGPIVTAGAVARECGISIEGGIILDGSTFRSLDNELMMEILPRLQVLARATASDKELLVSKLKEQGEVVAFAGDIGGDMDALRAADVAVSTGIHGSAVARAASSIVFADSNLESLLNAIAWGRSLNDSVKKVIQFQVPAQMSISLLAAATAMVDQHLSPLLSSMQMLWLHLVVDTIAVFAMTSDTPTTDHLDRPPHRKETLLFTFTMLKMVFGQMVFQLSAALILYYVGADILGLDRADPGQNLELKTMVFHTLFLTQVFSMVNNRQLRNRLNVFRGFFRNYFFMAVVFVILSGQVIIVYTGSVVFSLSPNGLDGAQWAICIMIAFLSMPFAAILRLIPDDWIRSGIRTVLFPAMVFNRMLWKVRLAIWPQKGGQSPGGQGQEEDEGSDAQKAPATMRLPEAD